MIDVLRGSAASLLNFRIWLTILALSAWGTSLGLINYCAGKKGMPAIEKRFPQMNPDRLRHYQHWYERWGARVLLLSSVPVLGTFLTVGAGIYGVAFAAFLVWSVSGLIIRNWIVFLFFSVVVGSF